MLWFGWQPLQTKPNRRSSHHQIGVVAIRGLRRRASAKQPRLGLLDFLNPLLAGICTFFVIALAMAGRSPAEFGAAALSGSLLVAAVILAWNRLQRPRAIEPQAAA
jgi:hypothetical protein